MSCYLRASQVEGNSPQDADQCCQRNARLLGAIGGPMHEQRNDDDEQTANINRPDALCDTFATPPEYPQAQQRHGPAVREITAGDDPLLGNPPEDGSTFLDNARSVAVEVETEDCQEEVDSQKHQVAFFAAFEFSGICHGNMIV